MQSNETFLVNKEEIIQIFGEDWLLKLLILKYPHRAYSLHLYKLGPENMQHILQKLHTLEVIT